MKQVMDTASSQIRVLAVEGHALVGDGMAKFAGAAHALDPRKLLTQLLLRSNWANAAVAATLGSCLACVLLLASTG